MSATQASVGGRERVVEELRGGFKAAMVAARRMRGRETHLQGQHLSYAQFGLMFTLAAGDGCGSARELAQQADLTPGTVTQMLDSLETAGLVERTRSTEDKRVVLTVLTQKGEQMLAARRAQMEPRWQQTVAQFSDEELRSAAAVLRALAGYFDSFE